MFTGVNKYKAFSLLINSIKNSDLLNLFNSQIETQILTLIKNMHELRVDKEVIFSTFIEAIKETGWLEEFFPTYLNIISGLNYYDGFSVLFGAVKGKEWIKDHFYLLLEFIDKLGDLHRTGAFHDLLKNAREIGVVEEHFLAFLENIENLSKQDHDPYAHRKHAFYELIDSVKDTKIMNIYSSQIETQFRILMNSIDEVYQDSVSALIKVAKEIGYITEYYPTFLNAIERLSSRYEYSAFSNLIISINANELLNIDYTELRTKFLVLLNNINNISGSNRYRAFSNLLKASEKNGWIKEDFPVFLRTIDTLSLWDQLNAFSILFKVGEETKWIQKHFSLFLKGINNYSDSLRYSAFSEMFNLVKSTDFLNNVYSLIETHFLVHLKSINTLNESVSVSKLNAFYVLIDSIMDSKLWNKFYSQIAAQFLIILESFEKLADPYVAFKNFIDLIKNTEIMKDNYSFIETQFYLLLNTVPDEFDPLPPLKILFEMAKEVEGWVEEKFPSFLDNINKTQGSSKYKMFDYLIKSIKNINILNKIYPQIDPYFLVLLKSINEFIHGPYQYRAFYNLINSIKGSKLWNKFYSQIESQLLILLNSIDKLSDYQNESYSKLIHAIEGTELIVKQFPAFLKITDKLQSYEQLYAFSDLIESTTNMELLKSYYCQIEAQFIYFLKNFDEIFKEEEEEEDEDWEGEEWEEGDEEEEEWKKKNSSEYKGFSSLLKIAKEKDWFKELLPVFLENIDKLPDRSFSNLLEIAKEKGLIEELFPTFLKALNLDKFSEYSCYGAFSDLFEIIKERGWIKEYFNKFFEFIYKFAGYNKYKNNAYYYLLEAVLETKLKKEYFLVFLESIERRGLRQKDTFYTLLNIAKKKGWIEEYLSNFLKAITKLPNDERYSPLSILLEIAIEEEWILEYFPTFLESLVKLSLISKNFEYRSLSYSFKGLSVSNVHFDPRQDGAFIKLLETAKEKGWMEKYFHTFLEIIENISENSYDNLFAYFHLIQTVKGTELLNGYSSHIKTLLLRYIDGFDKFPDYDKKIAYPKLIEAIKNTKLENESDFKKFKEKYSEFSTKYSPKYKQGSGW